MGRGSRSSEIGVKKERAEYSQVGGSVVGGSSQKESSNDNCLFSFKTSVTISLNEADGIENASSVVIVPHHSDSNRLELFIGGKDFGSYNGPHLKRILSCIQKNYIYDGTVQSVNKNGNSVRVEFLIQGRGR